jgi:ABC-2 type transport system permease protein
MAELAAESLVREPKRGIPARTQLLAVAWVRWRIFLNNTFRRRPTTARQAAGLVFAIFLRIIIWPFFALMVIGPIAGSGFLAWEAMAGNHPRNLIPLLAGIALLWQFASINGLNIAAAVSSFDPSSLTRFPLRFGRYLVLRMLFGLLTPSTVVGFLALMAAAAGIGLAKPYLALPAVVVLALYALMNVFLTRMIEAWVERWLANRRFREIFGVLMALWAVSFQFLNFQRAPLHGRGVPHSWLLDLMHGSGSYLNWLPPGFAGNAILDVRHPGAAIVQFAGLLASTALFAAIFAVRLHKQFLGEYLSEGISVRAPARAHARNRALTPGVAASPAAQQPARVEFPPIVGTCLRKEWLTLRGNTAQLIGLATPLIFIVIFSRASFAQHPAYFLPGAIAYALVGALAGLYNVFGSDGLGVQIYLLAPIRMRDVIIAKNLASLTLIVAEAGMAWILVSVLSHGPISLATQVATGLWLGFVIAINLALGTLRSIQAPRKYIPGQTRQMKGPPTSRTSSLLIFFVLFGSLALEVPVVLLSRYLNEPWLAAFIFAPFAAGAVFAYALLLMNAERLVLDHRDVLAQELCKA